MQDNLGTPTLQGHRLRRSVLQGAVVVFITAGYSGKRFVFERCKELGVKAVIIDGPDSWSQQLVEDGLAEDFVGVDFGDADTLFDRLLDTCRQVCARPRPVSILERLGSCTAATWLRGSNPQLCQLAPEGRRFIGYAPRMLPRHTVACHTVLSTVQAGRCRSVCVDSTTWQAQAKLQAGATGGPCMHPDVPSSRCVGSEQFGVSRSTRRAVFRERQP